MALTNAEPRARYRERRQADESRARSQNALQLVGRSGRVAAGRPACQRAAHVLRFAPALPGDTPSAPRLGWQLWALRPGLDGASRPSTTLTGRGGPPEVDLQTPGAAA